MKAQEYEATIGPDGKWLVSLLSRRGNAIWSRSGVADSPAAGEYLARAAIDCHKFERAAIRRDVANAVSFRVPA